MLIANPIYDIVFKRLMENERVAKFFVGTMLQQEIVSIEIKPQEFTYTNELVGLRLFRLDFIAVIKTEDGTNKKVLIEIQKAKKEIDLMRFRNYLAEQYKKEETVGDETMALPITTIYILGFNLDEIKSACIHVERQYRDMIEDRLIGERSDFIESLTHDSYVVQVNRITDRYQSRLDKLLSVFEQDHFVYDTEVVKDYTHQADVEEVKLITDILHHSGTDVESRKQLENEQEAWRTVNALMATKEKAFQKKVKEQQKELIEQKKALAEKDKALEEQQRLIEELKKKLDNS